MFHSARLTLTAWYLVIIMAISIAFSIFIYLGAAREFDRLLSLDRYRFEHPTDQVHVRILQNGMIETDRLPALPDPAVITDAKIRVLFALLDVNVIILILSALAGYFLAGRTLRPIQNMLDEQHRFITDASHELNTPLTSLKTTIEVNLRNKQLTLSKAKTVLESNLEEVNNLQELSAELIKLTQYQKPNGNFSVTSLLLPAIIQDAVEKTSAMAKQKEITISIKVPKISIIGDQKSLTEVFVILLDNAIKYSIEKSSILVQAKKLDGKTEISVQDFGSGIPQEDLPYIFDRFFRADKSRTKQQIPGYGLGLSIAKRIITLHNGLITVTSILNKGTTFTILLPKKNDES